MIRFEAISDKEIRQYVGIRKGETKLGERIHNHQGPWDRLRSLSSQFAIVGIQEDIGVRANNGIGGTDTAWDSFLRSFLNIQDTAGLSGENFVLIGRIKASLENGHPDVETLRKLTSKVDDILFPVIESIRKTGKIPIVIGGGHNNAYPILKGCSLAIKKPLNVINLDPHTDFRNAEGRHSGNGFRYAHQEGYLQKYSLLGLHEAYNAPAIVSELLKNNNFHLQFWEDLFLRHQRPWPDAVEDSLRHVRNSQFGVELDLDGIENILSSAVSPVGISAREAMQYLYFCGREPKATYLHLPEGIQKREDGLSNPLIGKLLSYLVQAFTKGVLERGVSTA